MVAVSVPPLVRAKALAHGSGAWLDDLPQTLAALAAQWSLEIGAPYTGGTEAYVVAVEQADGAPAVLKLMVPRAGNHATYEITVLRLADGHGCVRLLRADERRGALLLERLGPSLYDLGLPVARQQEILVAAARQVWRPAPGVDLPTGAQKGRWLADHITRLWTELDHPCAERTVRHALSCVEHRIAAHDDERAMLVHGDVHAWNALAAGHGDEFKLVDPDGLLAEPEYDLGIIMREDPVELMQGDPYRRAAWLAQRTGLDPVAIWEWGVVERVSTGLLGVQIGMQPVADEMLRAADRIAER